MHACTQVMVVTHGNTLRALVMKIDGVTVTLTLTLALTLTPTLTLTLAVAVAVALALALALALTLTLTLVGGGRLLHRRADRDPSAV